MRRIAFLSVLFVAAYCSVALAANTAPVITSTIGDFNAYAGGAPRSIDLTTVFHDPDATAAVRISTVVGDMTIELYGDQTPATVANFLRYVDEGRYFKVDPTTGQLASSFIHRSVPNFVIQGGGFIGTVNPSNAAHASPTPVATLSPVQNEPGISNKRGTIAMAKLANSPNSATSQWFINLADNVSLDDPSNDGGFTVFGRVADNGMSVADAIAALPRYSWAVFDSIPLRNYTAANPVTVGNLVSLPSITQISPLTFTATSDTPAVADVVLSGNHLLITTKQTGTAHITVTASDLDGASVSQSFTVTGISAPSRLVNISTRLQVGTDQDVLIGGFIVRGSAPKRLLLRGIGPSLASQNIANPLANPVLELHNGSALVATNDDWQTNTNASEIVDTTAAPSSPKEAALLTTVPTNSTGISYTAILRGANNSTGVGLVDVYDIDYGPGSTVLNISTRGKVDTGENVMIGGFFIGGNGSGKILVRGIGPSLTSQGVTNALADPMLELRNAQGTRIDANDDWQSSPQKSDIQASGIPPGNSKEAAMYDVLSPGAYTALLSGAGSTPSGVALVEIYQLP